MKYFLITYELVPETQKNWHDEIARFVAAIEDDPELRDAVAYRSFKTPEDSYVHLAATRDEAAAARLNDAEFFEKYTANVEHASGGTVKVTPLEVVAETKLKL